MRNIIIAIISAAFFGCSSGNQNAAETTAETAVTESSDTANTTGNVSSTDSTIESPNASAPSMLDSLRLGMSEEDVIRLVGEPTNKETIGNNPKVPMEDWWYGDNQKVRMVNHQVNVVVKDVARQKELMQQLMEAKKNKNDAEADRIMKELTKDIK
jgi:outer membrane protein assembly factor BamE (lipoprotein component of BamABCDE complex)